MGVPAAPSHVFLTFTVCNSANSQSRQKYLLFLRINDSCGGNLKLSIVSKLISRMSAAG